MCSTAGSSAAPAADGSACLATALAAASSILVVTRWAGFDLWRLKCRLMAANAAANVAVYAELAQQYLELAERLDARGCLDEARRMAAEII